MSHRGPRRQPSTARFVLPVLATLGVAFALGAGGGFLVAHEPEPTRVTVEVESPERVPEFVSGEVLAIDGERVTIETADGVIEVELYPVSLEALLRADGLEVGDIVNIGAERTPFGLALSGVVAIEDGAP